VTKPGNQLMMLRTLSLGLSSATLVFACVGRTDTGTDEDGSGEPTGTADAPIDVAQVPVPRPELCADNPLLAGCSSQLSAAGNGAVGSADPNANTSNGMNVAGNSPGDLARAAAEDVLEADCGQCHGPALTPEQAQGGMNYINDIDQLVENGKIVPLNSAGSLIIQRMRDGNMPPPSSGLPPVTEGDIDTVAQYIDNPRFWPIYVPAICNNENQLTTFDTLLQTIDRDLIVADAKDAQFYRYISISNRFTAGVCVDSALDQDRQALVKMLNMLSNAAKPGRVVPLDPNQTVYRIDLRDFNWNHPVVVNGQAFTDVWEATAANNPFNVQWVGDDANIAIATSHTNFPFQMSDMMMWNNTIGNVYYGIIGIDINQNINDFIANVLQVNVNDDLLQRTQVRAGTTKSRVSRQDRVVQRDGLVLQPGALWQSFDLEANDAGQSIFQDPFNFVAGGSEAIFSRPNGMLGFLVADENGVLQQDSDILLDSSQSDFKAVTSISCSNCHASGFLPVVDEVKAVALANARAIGLKQDQLEELQEIYVDPVSFANQVTGDNTLYQSALQRLDLPAQGVDPVSAIWLQFDADVDLDRAAGDLGLRPNDLKDNLDLVNPALSVLRNGGAIDRDDFTALYIDSLCRLSTPLKNVPLQATCNQAAAQAQALNGRI
jgi:mono/diheme cytochrome c family protein